MEMQQREFLMRARNGFLRQAEQSPETFVVVDASQPFEVVSSEVLAVVDDLLAKAA